MMKAMEIFQGDFIMIIFGSIVMTPLLRGRKCAYPQDAQGNRHFDIPMVSSITNDGG